MPQRTPKSAKLAPWQNSARKLAASLSRFSESNYPGSYPGSEEAMFFQNIEKFVSRGIRGNNPKPDPKRFQFSSRPKSGQVKESRKQYLAMIHLSRFFQHLDLNQFRVGDYHVTFQRGAGNPFINMWLEENDLFLAKLKIWASPRNEIIVTEIQGPSQRKEMVGRFREVSGKYYWEFLMDSIESEARRQGMKGLKFLKPWYNFLLAEDALAGVPQERRKVERERILHFYKKMRRYLKFKDAKGAYWVKTF